MLVPMNSKYAVRATAQRGLVVLALEAALGAATWAQTTITMASTTSTEQSGLFGHLLPEFKRASGMDVKVVAAGTGQAIDMARRGDAECCSCTTAARRSSWPTASRPALSGHVQRLHPGRPQVGSRRHQGQGHRGGLKKIAASSAPFVLRGDKSGTLRPNCATGEAGGQGQGFAGTRSAAAAWGRHSTWASSSNAYALADRGTWLSFKNRGDLVILVEGDKRLFNQYGVISSARRSIRT